MSNHTSNTHTVKDHNNNNIDIEVFRIDNCINGNPRYVVHFLPFADGLPDCQDIGSKYAAVCKLFNNAIHGRKYTAKWFGGGVVFSSYNISDDLTRVFEVKREIIRKALPGKIQGAADMLKEAAKQFRLNQGTGHAEMSEMHRAELLKVLEFIS